MSSSGDDALAQYVAAHYAGLLRTAFLLTGDRTSAQDLVQTRTGHDLRANRPASS